MKRLSFFALQAATEYSLVVVWCSAALFCLLTTRGPHAHERFSATLLWALKNSTPFFLVGLGLFLAAWGLQRTGAPLILIRVAGAIASPTLALLVARRSFFFLLDQPGYYWLGPLIFLTEFVIFALIWGVFLFPRLFRAGAAPRLHIHWAIIILIFPYVQSFVLHAVLGVPQQVFSPNYSLPRYFECVYARWTPGPEPLTVEAFGMSFPPPRGGLIPEPSSSSGVVNFHDDEIQRLRSVGMTGHIKVLGGVKPGNPLGRLVLIASHQVDMPFSFFAPGDADVIYFQDADGWHKLPSDAPDSNAQVRLYVPEDKPNVTAVEVQMSGGKWYPLVPDFVWEK